MPNNEVVTDRGIKTAQVQPPTVKVADLTGPGSSAERFGVGGTDLGIAVALADGRTGFIFGDTFDECRAGGPGWRSPVMLRSNDTSLRRLNDGITFHDAVGGDYARQLWDYAHDGPPWKGGGFSTVLPADAITIDGRLYLFVMVNRGLHNVLWTEINYSDDCGDTWHDAGPDARRLGSHDDGHQQLITWEHDPGPRLGVRHRQRIQPPRERLSLPGAGRRPAGPLGLASVDRRMVQQRSGAVAARRHNGRRDEPAPCRKPLGVQLFRIQLGSHPGQGARPTRPTTWTPHRPQRCCATRLGRHRGAVRPTAAPPVPSASCTAATSCRARRCAICIWWSATGTPPTARTGPTA